MRCRSPWRSTADGLLRDLGTLDLELSDLEWLRSIDGHALGPDRDVPDVLRSLDQGASRTGGCRLTLPLSHAGRVSGFVEVARFVASDFHAEDIEHARQVCNQIAVVLSNASLVEDLDRQNWGTLMTLARAIDAKSGWTAGHSSRVTDMGIEIGKVLGLSESESATCRRGGLLHDIGKIGVPAEILDKPAKLNAAETEKMRAHVLIGAKILEPLESFADALPIVLEHHEWFNESGYPYGKKGEELTVAGQIFAVADVFDAITSERPYRSGLPREEAINIIVNLSGRQFDPVMVDAFLTVIGHARSEDPEALLSQAV